jgi:hypothetical protein
MAMNGQTQVPSLPIPASKIRGRQLRRPPNLYCVFFIDEGLFLTLQAPPVHLPVEP